MIQDVFRDIDSKALKWVREMERKSEQRHLNCDWDKWTDGEVRIAIDSVALMNRCKLPVDEIDKILSNN